MINIFLKRTLLVILLIISFKAFCQTTVYDKYPFGQEAYKGGFKQLNNELHQIIKDRNLKPCDDDKQIYKVELIVKSDSTITLIKNPDSLYIKRNKCAYEMLKKTLPYLENWIPAKFKGENLNAIYTFDFIPNAIYNDVVSAEFPGGLIAFQRKFTDNFDVPSLMRNGSYKIELNFTKNTEGKIEDMQVFSDKYDAELEFRAKTALMSIKEKWKPGMINGVIVKSKMRLPITLNFE